MSSNRTLKIIMSLLAAFLATVLCFYFMYSLVSVELDPGSREPVRISMPLKPEQPSLKSREVRKQPKKMPPTEPPPDDKYLLQLPKAEVAKSEFVTLGSLAQSWDREALSIEFDPPIRNLVARRVVQPSYPFKAVMQEIEGYVIVQFTVHKDGTVRNPLVVESDPDEIFDMAALQAIKQFRFAPRQAGGDVLAAPGVRLRFRFELESAYPQ